MKVYEYNSIVRFFKSGQIPWKFVLNMFLIVLTTIQVLSFSQNQTSNFISDRNALSSLLLPPEVPKKVYKVADLHAILGLSCAVIK